MLFCTVGDFCIISRPFFGRGRVCVVHWVSIDRIAMNQSHGQWIEMCAGAAVSVVLNETRLSMLKDLKSLGYMYFNSQPGQQSSVLCIMCNSLHSYIIRVHTYSCYELMTSHSTHNFLHSTTICQCHTHPRATPTCHTHLRQLFST